MKLGILLLCAVLFSVHAGAQDTGRLELFGGYSRSEYSVFGLYSGPWRPAPFNGWEASAAFPFRPRLAVESDFVGGYAPPITTACVAIWVACEFQSRWAKRRCMPTD